MLLRSEINLVSELISSQILYIYIYICVYIYIKLKLKTQTGRNISKYIIMTKKAIYKEHLESIKEKIRIKKSVP